MLYFLNRSVLLLGLLAMSALMTTWFLLGLPRRLEMRRLVQSGHLVQVEVIRVNETHFGKRNTYYLHFRYQDRERASIRVGRDYLMETKPEQMTNLLHLPEYPDLFLPPNYDIEGEIWAWVLLIAFFASSMGICIYELFKPDGTKPPPARPRPASR